ncbi:isochorismatase family protein [Pseudoxanthomonas sp. PXM02]|uniref:isochorismatase family protein n=1 Tax=Pseudoxanthomonas sp. PXM02 TaxID=2769294 RepID=UPI00178382A6|nr:isochorismatase family protein [Pseudoxanthomonas sp. PXM02]MBD9478711.1 isochorismatase family protein [Pseudoxanthomonas sp. PXM02]
MTTALLVIDVQNDYFPGGALPLWNADATLDAIVAAIGRARSRGEHVMLVQHIAAAADSPLFQAGTDGVALHARIISAAPDAPVVVKRHTDSFHQTDLSRELDRLGTTDLRLAGMMTQNCVVFTALSPAAARYRVSVLSDCTTTTDGMIHGFALHALTTRVAVQPDA